MTNKKMNLTLVALSAFALAVLATPGPQSEAQAQTTLQQKKNTAAPVKRTPQVHVAPRVTTTPRVQTTPRVTTTNRTPAKLGTTQHKGPVVTGPKVIGPKVGGPKVVGPKVVGPKVVGPKVIAPKTGGPKTAKIFTPRGPKSRTVVLKARLRGFPARGAGRAVIGGRNYSVWRSGYRVRHGGGWRTFVALSALSAIAIGTYEYYPYAYISAPEPYCDGLTEDGCQLVWQDVETLDGDIIPQCVAYCPWQ